MEKLEKEDKIGISEMALYVPVVLLEVPSSDQNETQDRVMSKGMCNE